MDQQKDPVDILDEIMSRWSQPLPSPASYPPKFDPPAEDGPPPSPSKGKPPPAERLLPWLCALLGGAVVAALVLGFQLFSVNNRLDTLTAAVEEIQAVDELRKENDRLKTSVRDMVSDQQEALARKEELEQSLQRVMEQHNTLVDRSMAQNTLLYLERFNRAGDWLMSGTLVERLDGQLNPRNPFYLRTINGDLVASPQSILPSQGERYLELREELFDKGGCMVVEGFSTEEDGSDYTERPYIGEGVYEEQDLETARHLLSSILYYPINPQRSASAIAQFFQPDSGALERLSAGAFQPSTVELFAQVRSDLLAQGCLEETPDGTLRSSGGGSVIRTVYAGSDVYLPITVQESNRKG